MSGLRSLTTLRWLMLASILGFAGVCDAQNIERYMPLDLGALPPTSAELPTEKLPEVAGDDRVLVDELRAVVIVDHADKVSKEPSIDDLRGLHHDFDEPNSLVYGSGIRKIVESYLGQPITLRRINQLARDIHVLYRECKQPIVDVLIPEQRITGGTLHLVVIESRIGKVRVKLGNHFECDQIHRWIDCTVPGDRIYERNLESDLFWLNQNPFRRVTVDFDKGTQKGTTDVIYQVSDVFPMRGYMGIDDTGVDTLNYGRFFAGFTYGNLFGRDGTLGYQFTTDEDFALLKAHAINYSVPINRQWSTAGYASWAKVRSDLGGGINQGGESWQTGGGLQRHFIRDPLHHRSITFGGDFKSTDNNLEFAGTNVAASDADLFALRAGFEDLQRFDGDQYYLFRWDTFLGPGGGLTSAHSREAFQTIRPGSSPDFIYSRLWLERMVTHDGSQLMVRAQGQVSSERLLFSETLGLGGFDTLRGFDQRSYNADHGWIMNIELGPEAMRWDSNSQTRFLRTYGFVDMGNGYVDDPLPGENSYAFALSTGLGLRFQISDRLICRADYGHGLKEIDPSQRSSRFHFGVTWIPGKRP